MESPIVESDNHSDHKHQIKHDDHIGWVCDDGSLHCIKDGQLQEHRLDNEISPKNGRRSPILLKHGDHNCNLIENDLYLVQQGQLLYHGHLPTIKYTSVELGNCDGQMDDDQYISQRNKMIAVIIITALFVLCESAVGIYAHSMALLTDALHLLSDFIAFFIGLYIHTRTRNNLIDKTNQIEAIGSLMNSMFLLGLCLSMIVATIERAFEPDGEILNNGLYIIIVAGAAMVVNIINFLLLRHNHSHGHGHKNNHEHNGHEHKHENLNMLGLMLHVMGDFFSNIVVLASGLFILYTTYEWRYLADIVSSIIITIVISIGSIRLIFKSLKQMQLGI